MKKQRKVSRTLPGKGQREQVFPLLCQPGETGQRAETGYSRNQASENFVKSLCGVYDKPLHREQPSRHTDLLICGFSVFNTRHQASSTEAIPDTPYSSKTSLNIPKHSRLAWLGLPQASGMLFIIGAGSAATTPDFGSPGLSAPIFHASRGPSSPAAKQQTVFKLRSAASSQEHAGRLVNREKIVHFETLRESQDLFC